MAIHIDYEKCVNEKPIIVKGAYLYKNGNTPYSVGNIFPLHFASDDYFLLIHLFPPPVHAAASPLSFAFLLLLQDFRLRKIP